MIWALLAWYFFGGGAGSGAILTSADVDNLEERTAIVIEDDTRRQSAARELKALKKDVKAFEKAFSKSGKQLNKAYKTHEGGREDALAVLDDLNTVWAATQDRALDARFALRDELTKEEWMALFKDSQ